MNQPELAPRREIGLPGAVLINLNGVVGAGIFALPALLYAGTGSLAPLIVILYAFFVAATMLVAAKLSTLFDQSGGPQLYVEKAFGPFGGFQAGFFLLGQNIVARAANFHVLVAYLAAIFPVLEGPVMQPLTVLALIALASGIAIIGTRTSINALWLGTALKLGPIIAICLAGFAINGLPSTYVLPEFSGVESIALMLAYAYSGGALSTVAAGETRDPTRTVYRSIFVNLTVVALLYAFVQWAYIAIDPQVVNPDRPLASAGEVVFGQAGVLLISVAAIFSIGTNQMSYFVSMPRLIYGMSRRGLLPHLLSHVSPRFGTPAIAIATYGVIVALLALTGGFEALARFMVALESMVGIAMIAGFALMWRRGTIRIGGAMAIFWGLVVVITLGFTLWLMAQVPASAAVPTVAVLVAGTLLYFLMAKRTPEAETGDA